MKEAGKESLPVPTPVENEFFHLQDQNNILKGLAPIGAKGKVAKDPKFPNDLLAFGPVPQLQNNIGSVSQSWAKAKGAEDRQSSDDLLNNLKGLSAKSPSLPNIQPNAQTVVLNTPNLIENAQSAAVL